MAVARINVPKTAQRGEVIEIRTLISHIKIGRAHV
mgnify:CR=1 FL=1